MTNAEVKDFFDSTLVNIHGNHLLREPQREGRCPGCRGNSACGRVTAHRLYATASFVSTALPNALISSGISR